MCTACVVGLASPASSTLPGSPHDKLKEMLFGEQPAPHITANASALDMGVKTKKQLIAERALLQTLLEVSFTASADQDLADKAQGFAVNLSRHFALLFAAGIQSPPPAPYTSRHAVLVTAAAGSPAPSAMKALKELDARIVLDAFEQVRAVAGHLGK